ncbi:uncharacterized protein BO87DRAFT_404793 [Aspergillus neoniger CBS 115656]|uniref:Uncharacterized protein n=1 Tax=Aspergillus neoniger (strain CBS 115656) TaxID=1448310 RepID=A0A318YRX6_ASPNB|nr:hypothetical protein BO87DRAFT_404793 [Aspergillus neoniger CBS 115656]PYH37126.1 hypothetical protein BO87DRAFT_404793 [Aspergillus neoniger CBS 115656]
MATRTVYLMSFRGIATQRAHFAIFVPSAAKPDTGTMPLRNYSPKFTKQRYEIFPIGEVSGANIVDSPDGPPGTDNSPKGNIEIAASQVPTPRKSENFMAPVNETTNKRCQEWTMEFIRHLVSKGLIGEGAIEIVQSKRDPPTHGIGLQRVAGR